jgi:hypothetical protein
LVIDDDECVIVFNAFLFEILNLKEEQLRSVTFNYWTEEGFANKDDDFYDNN